jgi:glycosyltransferase involved in cell wall biosynthesis
MRLLLFNLATDADDPILGFTTRWISALAKQVEFIHVVTMRAGRVEVPNNVRVYSLGKEKGDSEPRRAVKFYRLLFHILRKDRIDVCFSHMTPLFTILAASVLKTKAIPIVTWYAHPSLTWILRLAHHLSDRMVTSISDSYPYKHDKLSVIGHGIDSDIFSPGGQVPSENTPTILCVGRLSPVKDHLTLLKAAWLLRQHWTEPFRVVIVGGPAAGGDGSYVRLLHGQVEELGLEDTVYFEPPVPGERLPYWYRRCTVHVNLTPKGFVDKVALEAMSCAKPCLVANEGFKETLGIYTDKCLYAYRDPEQLADRMRWALSLSDTDRMVVGMYLRRQVESMHGLKRLVNRLVEIFEVAMNQKRIHRSDKNKLEELRF